LLFVLNAQLSAPTKNNRSYLYSYEARNCSHFMNNLTEDY